MNWKLIIAVWATTIGLIAFFAWFGLSDFLHHTAPAHNPLRPAFRFIFGLIMACLTFAIGWLLTKSLMTRTR